MESFQLPKIDAVNLQQISEISTNGTSQVNNDKNELFLQTLNSKTKVIENSQASFKVVRTDNAASVEKSLEKMIISLMMKPMFAEFAEFTFGKGVEADVYSSLFSDAVADKIATGGSFGLGKYTQTIKFDEQSSTK